MTPFPESKPILSHRTWSPSKLALYESCALKARYKYLDKLPDPPGPALARGTEIHKYAELYVIGEAKELHPTLQQFEAQLKEARAKYAAGDAHAELELAFKEDWSRCDWFDPMVWVRFKTDYAYRVPAEKLLVVVDFKTGKFRPEDDSTYQEQLSLYCLAFGTLLVNKAHPWLEELAAGEWSIRSELWFLDHGKTVQGETLTPAGFPALKEQWTKRVARLLADTEHVPTPGPACRFCPWSKKRQGYCKFG